MRLWLLVLIPREYIFVGWQNSLFRMKRIRHRKNNLLFLFVMLLYQRFQSDFMLLNYSMDDYV